MDNKRRDSHQPSLPPPFISIPGLHNIRDIGGWPISTPTISTSTAIPSKSTTQPKSPSSPATTSPLTTYRVRRAILYRSDDLTLLPPTSAPLLHALHISTILDIRSVQQIQRAGREYSIPGVPRIWTPIFPQEAYTPEKAGLRYKQYAGDGTTGIVGAFEEILVHGREAFREVLLRVGVLVGYFEGNETESRRRRERGDIPDLHLEPDEGLLPEADDNANVASSGSKMPSPTPPAILIHCTTGNNRTGALIGVLLSLLGVPPSSIAEEYALSDLGLAATRHIAVARLVKNPTFAAAFGDEVEARAERMLGARMESMFAMLEMVEAKWGGAEGYVREVLGLSAEEVERVKVVLTEEVGADAQDECGGEFGKLIVEGSSGKP